MSDWVTTYERGRDYTESLNGIPWYKLPMPERWHRCAAQTRGRFDETYVERCACGAGRSSTDGEWQKEFADGN